MLRFGLIFGLALSLFSPLCIANEDDADLIEAMGSLLDQASRETLSSGYLKQLHRTRELKRISPLEELYIQILVTSGVDPLPTNGFERNVSDILKQSFPYFGSELSFYYEKYQLVLLPGLCHWSYLHFKRLDQWLKKNDLRPKKILYALPNQKFTQKLPLIEEMESKKVPVSAYLLSYGGRWISHLSWGALNTVVGGLIGLGYIVKGLILDHDLSGSFENGSFPIKADVEFSIGPFYFTSDGKYYAHEAGHTYQAAILGPLYLPIAGISAIVARGTDPLLEIFSGGTSANEWGELDRELQRGVAKKEELALIKEIPRIILKPSPERDNLLADSVLKILLDSGADIEAIQFLKQRWSVWNNYLGYLPLPLIDYLDNLAPSHKKTLERALEPYFPSNWYEDPDRKKATYEALLKRLETEEPINDSFWLDLTNSFLTLNQKKDLFNRLLKQLRNTKRPLWYRERLQRVIRGWLPSLWSRDFIDPREYYLGLNTPILQ